MTMRVEIKNDHLNLSLRITRQRLNPDAQQIEPEQLGIVPPGETREAYVYKGGDVTLSEVEAGT